MAGIAAGAIAAHALHRESAAAPPVYLIPGLGADSRGYRGAWTEIPGAVFVEWPAYVGEMSVPAVAKFVADAWRVPDGAVLVATSFGGAVACEIAKLRSLRALVLVASSADPADYHGARSLRRWRRWVSLARIQRFLRQREGIRRQRHGHTPSAFTRALLDSIEQFTVCDLAFYEGMLDALAEWPGGSGERTPLVRIHGTQDRKVRVPREADLLLDAGHLVALTHARECADFLIAALARDFTPA